jgi:polysaccharide biosynthesis/export protein
MIGKDMKALFPTMPFAVALLLPVLGIAQQPKPVLSATPAPVQAPPPVAAHSTTAPGTPLKLDPTYVIGPDDSIMVTVWKEPTLSGNLPVRPDGMISITLLGDVPAAGRTPMVLAAELTERLKKFVNDPTVTVSVLAVNSKRVFMAGEIGRVGPLALTSDMNPLQAILASGGLSPYASKTKIYILRTIQGKQKKLIFNYKKAIKDGDMQGITLLPGDTIVVP